MQIAPITRPEEADTGLARETFWGYALQAGPAQTDADILRDRGLRGFGILVLICAYAIWLLPSGLFAGNPLVMKFLMWLTLGGLGACIVAMGTASQAAEVHVDVAKRELRFVSVNSRGAEQILRVVPMDIIQSVVLRGESGLGKMPTLSVRLANTQHLLKLTSGPERDLMLLHNRLCEDFKAPAQRLEARIAQSPIFSSSRLAA